MPTTEELHNFYNSALHAAINGQSVMLYALREEYHNLNESKEKVSLVREIPPHESRSKQWEVEVFFPAALLGLETEKNA